MIRNAVYADSRQALYSASHGDSHEAIADRMTYDTLANHIMEHSFFFLLPKLLVAEDAPLPHVVYEDMLKCKTFSSLQLPPEEQFALEPELLRAVLCMAAHELIMDPQYFGTCENLFRVMEQQQRIDTKSLSAFLFCCTAAGQVREALNVAKMIAQQGEMMDPLVFSLMMHPSSSPKKHDIVAKGPLTESAKGFLLQRRLQSRLSSAYKADSVAVHSMFVMYSLTLNHFKKWETIRVAVEEGVELCDRTLRFVMEVYRLEKGQRCGPKTQRCLLRAVATSGSVSDLLYVVLRSRMNDELLPHSAFESFSADHASDEVELVVEAVRRRQAQGGDEAKLFAMALPVVETLLRTKDRNSLRDALDHFDFSKFPSLRSKMPSPTLPHNNSSNVDLNNSSNADLTTNGPPASPHNAMTVPAVSIDRGADSTVPQETSTPPQDPVDSFLAILSSIVEQDTKKSVGIRKGGTRKTRTASGEIHSSSVGVAHDERLRHMSPIEAKKVTKMVHVDLDEAHTFRRATSELERNILSQHESDWRRSWTNVL